MKNILWISLAFLFYSCGSSGGGSAGSIVLSIESLTGFWKLKSITQNSVTTDIHGNLTTQYKADGTFVVAGQGYYPTGGELNPCWYVGTGTYTIDGTTLTETMTEELGRSNCADADFNPIPYSVNLTQSNFSEKNADGIEANFEKQSTATDLVYADLRAKFENITLTITDSDMPTSLDLTRRIVKTGDVKLCRRLTGGWDTSGFTIDSAFNSSDSIYDIFLQWDEGKIDPDGYDGGAPNFRFEKRSSASSDSGKGVGTGMYLCSNSECNNKCHLKFSSYSLANSSADIEISCEGLPAYRSNDADNIFGTQLTGFNMKVSCNYKPTLFP